MLITPENATAKSLIQVTLTYRKNTLNRLGAFHVFQKGGWFGHADQLLKWCPHGTCTGLISDNFKLTQEQVNDIGEDKISDTNQWPIKYKFLYDNWYSSPTVCPKCNLFCKSMESLPDSYGFQLPEDRIAKKMASLFYELGGDCDIYLVRNKQYMGYTKAKEHRDDNSTSSVSRQVRSEAQLARMRAGREKVFYPLKSILADSSGTDVSAVFKSLLGA
jgi:hypothetical protein